MTRFAHVEYSIEHAGVARAENAIATIGQAVRNFDGARGAATFLLAAVVSALMVVANQVVDTWTEGHLIAAWIALWVVAFVAMAFLTLPARRAGVALRTASQGWNANRRQADEDKRTWNVALADHRVMADLAMAADRK